MAVVFELLRAIAEYWFRIKNGISLGTFWFQIEEYERVNNNNNIDFNIGHTPEIQINALYNTNMHTK